MAGPYRFRPMTMADLPLIKQWLALPHVREWWGDPAEQYALVSGDLDEPAMDQFIVAADGSDFGYIQCYDLTAWNSGFEPSLWAPAASISSSASRTWCPVDTARR